jgi:hypothetical protein
MSWRGVLRYPDGTPAASARAAFTPEPFAVASGGGALTVPRAVTAETDATGALVVALLPGTYAVRVVAATGRWFPTFHVEAPGDWLVPYTPPTEDGALLTAEDGALLTTEAADLIVTEAA